MKITIIAVGRIKEKFYREAMAEYGKRLGKYCRFEVIETEDEKTPDKAGQALEEQIKEKEGQRILKYIKEDAYVITLEIQGQKIGKTGHLWKKPYPVYYRRFAWPASYGVGEGG